MEKLHESGPSGVVPKIMPLELLKKITNNFSEDQKLGGGTFGKVYKGVHNGEEIAVKLLYLMPEHDDLEQFKREFENLRRLRHQNIVQLLGYCYEIKMEYVELSDGRTVFGQNIYRALCFQYMHNGSLRKHLSDECHGLDWQTRYKIIKGTCEGLKYLHEGSKNPIYHLDLKPDNILLDKDMVPKLADFGLSKLVCNDHTQATQSFAGTIGYLPPEYIEKRLVSIKLDIFSLGVIIIQIMSGENGYRQSAYMSSQDFINLVLDNWRNRLLEETSRCTSPEAECHQVKRVIEIALDCIHADRKKRPKIGDIVHWLNETEPTIKKMGLDVYPLHIWFPLESDKVIKCPVTLVNKTDDSIGVFVAPTSLDGCFNPCYPYVWEQHNESTIFRRLEPNSSETIYMTMKGREQPLLETVDRGIFDVVMVAIKSEEDLELLDEDWNHGTLDYIKELSTVMHLATLIVDVTSDPAICQEVAADQFIPATPDGDYNYICCMDVHPTKTWLLVGYSTRHISIWNYETQERITEFEVEYLKGQPKYNHISSIKFIMGEQWFAVGDNIGGVHVYAENYKVKEFKAHDDDGHEVTYLAVYPEHTLLLTASWDDRCIKLWDWSKRWTCARVIETDNSIYDLTVGPRDASTIASSTGDDEVVKVWDIRSLDVIATFKGRSLTFWTDDSHRDFLASLSYDSKTESKNAKIWDFWTKKHVHTLCPGMIPWEHGHGHLRNLAGHPTLPILAGIMTRHGSNMIQIVLWDVRTYRVVKRVELTMKGAFRQIVFDGTKDITSLVVSSTEEISIIKINVSMLFPGC